MDTAIDLVAREGAYLLVLLALGAGPASLLAADRFNWATRLALTPILGFCLGTCIATSVLYFFPTGDTFWMLIPLGLASLAFAARRTRRFPQLNARDAVQLALVLLAVTVPLSGSFVHRGTVGPVAFYYTDTDGYVAVQDAAAHSSLREARATFKRLGETGTDLADRSQWNWGLIVTYDQNLDAAPLNSNMNELLGLGATDTHSPFLIIMLLNGALAVFAGVRYATRSATWAAVLAGAMFAGPLFLELFFDGYQAAVIAVGLVPAAAIAAAELVRRNQLADAFVLALPVATLASVYPLYLPVLVAFGGLLVLWLGWRAWRAGTFSRATVRPVIARLATLVGFMVVLGPVQLSRDFNYYRKVLDSTVPLPRVPWTLPLDILPGWLLQTRGFWAMPPLADGGFKQLILGGFIPLVFIAVGLFGLWRYRIAIGLLVIGAIFALLAEYSWATQDKCAYCAGRVLLPLAVVGAVALALGLTALWSVRGRWGQAAAVALAALVVVTVAQRARIELARYTNGSYFLDQANRDVLADLPSDAAGVHIEGFGQTLAAQAEQPLVYHLVNEHIPGRVSVSFSNDLRNAIQYLAFGTARAPGPEFNPQAPYILTRFGAIDSGREVIARSGPIALQRRTPGLEIISYGGLAAPLVRVDPSGTAWIQPNEMPLRFHIVGADTGPAWAKITIRSDQPLSVPRQVGVETETRGDETTLCVLAEGEGEIRDAMVNVTTPYVFGKRPNELFPPAAPSEGAELISMRAVSGGCEP